MFDLPHRRIPAAILEHQLSREQILAALAQRAVTAMGIATADDVATYYNLSTADTMTGLQALPAQPVMVEEWTASAWLTPDTEQITEEIADWVRPG